MTSLGKRAYNCSKMLNDTLTLFRACKPDDRSETARRYSITITELEKALAYFEVWVVKEAETGPGGGND